MRSSYYDSYFALLFAVFTLGLALGFDYLANLYWPLQHDWRTLRVIIIWLVTAAVPVLVVGYVVKREGQDK